MSRMKRPKAGSGAVDMADSAAARAMTAERRKNKRNSIFDHALVPVEMEPAGFGLMLDVSESGLGVQVLNTVEPGTTVEFAFTLPDTTVKVEGNGLVTRYDAEGRAGISVQNLKNGSAESLKRWIASLPHSTVQKDAGPLPTMNTAPVRVREVQAQIAAQRLDLGRSLQLIVEKVVEITGSHGAAIALGSAEDMVCKASTGLAPEVGVKIDSSSALTGECIRTGKIVHCDDTELDRRVDREVCRQLNLRSSLIVPVLNGREIGGVLEAFSPTARSYSEQHIELLQAFAEMTAGLAYSRQDPKPTIVPAPASLTIAPVNGNGQSATAAKPAKKKEDFAPRSVAPSALSSIELGDLFNQAVSGPEPVSNIQPEERIAAPVTEIPFADEAFRKATAETTRGRLLVIVPIAVLVLVLVLGVVLWRRSGTTEGATVIPPGQTSTPQTVVPAQPSAPMQSTETKVAAKTTASSKPARSEEEVAADSVRPSRSTDERLILTPGRQSARAEDAPILAPAITGITAGNMGAVNLPTTAKTPVLGVQSSNLTGGRLVHKVTPSYPTFAKQQRYEGEVVLAIRITKLGTVENVRRVKGNAVLATAAIQAVSEWRYEPYRLNGEPQDVDTNVSVVFKLPK